MRAVVALALILLASPASAHCFTVWRYPWPQHCTAGAVRPVAAVRVAYAAPRQAQALALVRPPSQRIVPLQSDDRAIAIELLKRAMRSTSAPP